MPFDAEALGGLQGDDFRAIFPEDIRGQEYMKDINDFNGFVKKFDGAQKLIGQRNIPGPDAPAAEWDAYFTQAGRPATPDEYNVPTIEGLDTEKIKATPEFNQIRQAMHKAGMNPIQADNFMRTFLPAVAESNATVTAAKEQAFDKFMTDTFGKDKDLIFENGKKILAGNVPENLQPLMEQLDDKAYAVIFGFLDNVVKKHVNEDGFRGGPPAGGGGAVTKETLVAQMKDVMRQPEYQDPFKNPAKHRQLLEQMKDIRAKLRTAV